MVYLYLFFAPPLLCCGAGMAAAVASGRSFRAGVQAALWAVVIGALATFVLWMPEALYRYGVDAGQLLDGEDGLPFDNNLHYAIWWCLLWLPAWGLPFGVFGAAAGARKRGAQEA